jgi:glycosyltransferase involved in cell wall biosynthesis
MKIVHVSYARINTYSSPVAWLHKINFFTGVVEAMGLRAELTSIHCIDYTGVLERSNVSYHFFKCSAAEGLLPTRIHHLIKTLEPDAVIVHGMGFPWQVIQLACVLKGNTKLFIQNHAEKPLHFHKAVLQQWADRRVNGYFFTASALAGQWVDQRQVISPSKIHEVMEVSSAFYPLDPVEARKRTGVTEVMSFLWVGRLDANKDPLTLIRGFIQFLGEVKTATLYIIFHMDELLSEIQQLLNAHPQYKQQIILVGQVKHDVMIDWFSSVDFIISTSHYEGSGVAVCEAMSCGCIPVLTDIPSFRMMTGDGSHGMLFEPGNASDLAAKLSACVALDIAAEKKKVLEQFQKNLSFDAIARKMIQAIGG